MLVVVIAALPRRSASALTCNVSGRPVPSVTRWSLADYTRHYEVGAQADSDRIQV